MKKTILLFASALALFTCSTENTPDAELLSATSVNDAHISDILAVSGIKYSEATIAAQASYNRFINSINKIDAISIVAEVDHQQNAKSVGLDLDPTQVVLFGNPVLGTPLMQENQLAGLDLPQKVLFYRDADKNDFALYNSVEYLSSRHNLEGVTTLNQISMALNNLVSKATKSEVKSSLDQTVAEGEGIVTKDSNNDFNLTYSKLRDAIASNPNLRIVTELNHKANAASVGMELAPTSLIVFGNPNLGTPLMQSSQTVGLDLPQKMLVWQDEDGVHISYNDPYYLADRHNLEGVDAQLNIINAALNNLSDAASAM